MLHIEENTILNSVERIRNPQCFNCATSDVEYEVNYTSEYKRPDEKVESVKRCAPCTVGFVSNLTNTENSN